MDLSSPSGLETRQDHCRIEVFHLLPPILIDEVAVIVSTQTAIPLYGKRLLVFSNLLPRLFTESPVVHRLASQSHKYQRGEQCPHKPRVQIAQMDVHAI